MQFGLEMAGRMVALVLFVLAAPAAAGGSAQATTQQASPIQKVISMMSDMIAKGKAEKQDETVRFAQYKAFCEMTAEEKKEAITESTEQVEDLKAEIQQAGADAAKLAKEISAINADVTTWKAEVEKATAARAQENKDFVATEKDYTESIDGVERAMKTLKEKSASLAQTSLIELSSKKNVPVHAKRLIASFLQEHTSKKEKDSIQALLQDKEEFEEDAPEAKAYGSGTGGVTDMVEKLGEKFEAELEAAQKREGNMKQSFLMMTRDLKNQIEDGESEVEDKMTQKAKAEKDEAEGKGSLAETSQMLAEDTKFLSDLNAECETKSYDYEKRQEVRQGEIEAINKAIEIMSSPEVSGGSAFPQTGQSFGQLRSKSRTAAQDLVTTFLGDRARASGSKILSLIAAKASDEPFKKVTKMIEDMITKLMEEAAEEAEHKGFCDTEMGTNKMTRDAKTEEVASLKAEMDELSAGISKLAQDIQDLSTAVALIDASVAKATAERAAENEKNTQTITDAKVAQEATAKALSVLKEFYAKAAQPVPPKDEPKGPIKYDARALAIISGAGGASLAQVPGGPEMEGGEYKGMEGGGVTGLLEVVESDFASVVAETSASEADAASGQEEFLNDCTKDKAIKGADIKNMLASKTEKESELASAKTDMRVTNEELSAALEYFEKLKPSCVDAGMSYEERVQKRKDEIESLREALKILSE